MIECGLVVSAVVKDVSEVYPRLGVIFIQLEGPAQGRDCGFVVAQSMLGVADARHCLRWIGRLRSGRLEVLARFLDQAIAEQRTSDLEHELDVVFVAKLERSAEWPERCFLLSEFQKGFAEPGQCILMVGVEDQRFLETPARPREFLARMVGVADADVQLHRIGVECKSLTEYLQGFIILAFVVQLMRSFVILLGTQKRGGHGRSQPPTDRVAL